MPVPCPTNIEWAPLLPNFTKGRTGSPPTPPGDPASNQPGSLLANLRFIPALYLRANLLRPKFPCMLMEPPAEDERYVPLGERIICIALNSSTTSCGIAIYSDVIDALVLDSLPVSSGSIEEMYYNLKQVRRTCIVIYSGDYTNTTAALKTNPLPP